MHQGPPFSALVLPEGRSRQAQFLRILTLKEVTIVGSWGSNLCKVHVAAVGVVQYRHPPSVPLCMVVYPSPSPSDEV